MRVLIFALLASLLAEASAVDAPADCIKNLTDIYLAERVLFQNETASSYREYILCPNTVFETGIFDDMNIIRNGQHPISPRTNMVVKCGPDGARSNNCTVRGGGDGVIMVPDIYVWNEELPDEDFIQQFDHRMDNFLLSGVVITDTIFNAIFIQGMTGLNVSFIDCEFVELQVPFNIQANHLFSPPPEGEFPQRSLKEQRYLDYLDTHPRMRSRDKRLLQGSPLPDAPFDQPLEITWESCLFKDITNLDAAGQQEAEFPDPAYNQMMYSFNAPTKFTLRECVFEGNDYSEPILADILGGFEGEGNGALIFGGMLLEVDSCCFIDNKVTGLALIEAYAPGGFVSNNNYVNPVDASLQCEWAFLMSSPGVFECSAPFERSDFCPLVEEVDGPPTPPPSPAPPTPILPTLPTTQPPTLPPATPAPVSDTCISNLDDINFVEFDLPPEEVANVREYILCPGVSHYVARVDANSEPVEPGFFSLFLRSNAIVKCGNDGARSNECTITGNAGVETVYDPDLDAAYGEAGTVMENVMIQGITFTNFFTRAVQLWGYTGNVQFEDCAFLDTKTYSNIDIAGPLSVASFQPLVLECTQGYDASGYVVTFSNCLFEGNESVRTQGGTVSEALFYGSCESQTIEIRDSIFRNNDWTVDPNNADAALFSNRRGGGIVIDGTCFENNKVNSVGPVITRRLDTQVVPQVTNTFADTDTADGTCGVLTDVVVEELNTLSVVVSTTCVAADANVCALTGTVAMSPAPTLAPTPTGTMGEENSPPLETSTAVTAKMGLACLAAAAVVWIMMI